MPRARPVRFLLALVDMANMEKDGAHEGRERESFFPPPGASPRRGALAASGFRLGRLFGIDIRIDWSLSIIFALIVFDLGAGMFPAWHPQWSPVLAWATALAAALLFFASVLAHELSHALVARAKGLAVPRITLFLFGGVSELEREPGSPGTEALIAIVGPLTSLAIGIGSLLIVGQVADPSALPSFDAGLVDSGDWLRSLGPLPTLLLWLGPLNITLAVFNLIPGFPLDGGRVLRAILWWATSDLHKATRWAAHCGQLVGWTLMIIGVLNVFRGGVGDGLWLVLIGWFLSNAARMSIEHQLLTQALAGVTVGRVMRTRFERIDPGMPVQDLAGHVLRSDIDQRAFPVERDGVLLGLVCLKDLRKIPQSEWAEHTVGEIMTPSEELTMLHADVSAEQAAEQLARHEVDHIPVVAESPSHLPQLLGMVRRADILRWVYLSGQTA